MQDEELKRLEIDAKDAEEASVQAEKDLIDAQAWAESRHRAAMDARRAAAKYRYETGI